MKMILGVKPFRFNRPFFFGSESGLSVVVFLGNRFFASLGAYLSCNNKRSSMAWAIPDSFPCSGAWLRSCPSVAACAATWIQIQNGGAAAERGQSEYG